MLAKCFVDLFFFFPCRFRSTWREL